MLHVHTWYHYDDNNQPSSLLLIFPIHDEIITPCKHTNDEDVLFVIVTSDVIYLCMFIVADCEFDLRFLSVYI